MKAGTPPHSIDRRWQGNNVSCVQITLLSFNCVAPRRYAVRASKAWGPAWRTFLLQFFTQKLFAASQARLLKAHNMNQMQASGWLLIGTPSLVSSMCLSTFLISLATAIFASLPTPDLSSEAATCCCSRSKRRPAPDRIWPLDTLAPVNRKLRR